MEQQPTQTFRRNPFEILGECFSIYGRHFRNLFLIALIIHIVIGALGFVILPSDEELQTLIPISAGDEQNLDAPQFPSINQIADLILPFSIYLLATLVLQAILGGAITYAVAMQYATGTTDVGTSYERAFWRVLTLIAIGLLSFVLIILMLVGFVLLVLPGIVILTLIIYWSIAVQAVVMEGYKPISALKRSFELVRSNWLRTFAAWVLVLLIMIGLSLIIGVPINMVIGLVVPQDGGILEKIVESLTSTLVEVLIAPITGIVGALIYFDLRARKEDYGMNELAEQMGIVPPDNTTT